MRYIRSFFVFLFLVTCCKSYGNENTYVFVGQNNLDGQAQTAFVLELVGENLEDYVQINEDGEVYLKVDKLVTIPGGSIHGAPKVEMMIGRASSAFIDEYEASMGRDGSRESQSKRWQCPYCYHWWRLGEKCQNPQCPTNNWNRE